MDSRLEKKHVSGMLKGRLLPNLLRGAILGVFLFSTLVSPYSPLLEQAGARYLETRLSPGNFKTARTDFTATVINAPGTQYNGQVLITGGVDAAGAVLSSAEVYNPKTGTFATLPVSLNHPRVNHAAVALPDGRILLVGGRSASATYQATMEFFDPNTNTFESNNMGYDLPTLPEGREHLTATLYTDTGISKVLIAGGFDGTNYSNTAYRFTPEENTLLRVTGGTGTMIQGRARHAGMFFPQFSTKGAILFVGGTNAATGVPVAADQNEYYDINLNRFVTAAVTMTDARSEFIAVDIGTSTEAKMFIAGGKRTLTGNSDTGNTISCTKPNASTPCSTFTITSPTNRMAAVRKGAVAFTAFENNKTNAQKVYILGGEQQNNTVYSSIETYVVSSNSFATQTANVLAMPRSNAKLVVLPTTQAQGATVNNTQALILGGRNTQNAVLNSAEFYDPYVFQRAAGEMFQPRMYFDAYPIFGNVNSALNGKFLILGGSSHATGSSNIPAAVYAPASYVGQPVTDVKHVEIYDPVTNSFSDLCGRALPTDTCQQSGKQLALQKTQYASAQLGNGKVMIAGGVTRNNNTIKASNTIEIFNPQTEIFTSIAVPAGFTPRWDMSAVTLPGGNKVLITGGFLAYANGEVYGGWGYVPNNFANDAWIYDDTTQTLTQLYNGFDPVSTMVQARAAHSSVLAADGNVYIFGGVRSIENSYTPQAFTPIVEKYEPTTGSFTQVMNTGPAMANMEIATYNNGNSIVLAGDSFKTTVTESRNMYLYNVGDTTMTTLTNAFQASAEGREMVAIGDSKFLISGGGVYGNRAEPTMEEDSNDVYIWDSKTPTLPPQRRADVTTKGYGWHAAVRVTSAAGSVLNTGKVALIGGTSNGYGGPYDIPAAGIANIYDDAKLPPDMPTNVQYRLNGTPTPLQGATLSGGNTPSFLFNANDSDGDELMYQVQILPQTDNFATLGDAEATNASNRRYNFIQRNTQLGFVGQNGVDNQYYRNGTPGELSYSAATMTLPNGEYQLRVRAIDLTGSRQYSTWTPAVTFSLNNVIPNTAITKPSTGGTLNLNDFQPIQGTASDDVGLDRVLVSVRDVTTGRYWNGLNGFSANTELFFAATGTSTWEYAAVNAWESGHSYEIRAKAVNTSNNQDDTPATIAFMYDSSVQPPMTVTVTSPNGGENLVIGTNHNITWTSGGIPSHYELYYSTDDFATQTPINTTVSGALTSYSWTIPNNASSTMKVKVVAVGAGGAELGQDVSDGNFTTSNNGGDTVAPTVAITAPVHGSHPTSISSVFGTHNDPTATAVKVTIKDTISGDYWNGSAFVPAADENAAKLDASSTASPWSYDTTAVPFVQGTTYEFKAYVTDPAGNEGVATSVVTFGPEDNSNTNTSNENTDTDTGNTNENQNLDTGNTNQNSETGNTNVNSSTGNTNANTDTSNQNLDTGNTNQNTGTGNSNVNSSTGNTNTNTDTSNQNQNAGIGNTNTNTGGTQNQNTNTGNGNNQNQNSGNNGNNGGNNGNEVVCPAGYIYFSGGCVAFNPFQQQPTQPTPAPVVITTPSPSYPSYPYYPYPTPASSNQNTATPDTAAPLAVITFPATGATPTSMSSVQGTAQDTGGSGLYYTEIDLYNETTGRYFDGSSFTSTARQGFIASGSSVWSMALPNSAFTYGQKYTFTARARDNAGNVQELPSRVTITYMGTGEEPTYPSAPSQTNVNGNTDQPTTDTDNDGLLLQILASLEAMANRPVNVTVTNPNIGSSTPPTVIVQNPTNTNPATGNTSSANITTAPQTGSGTSATDGGNTYVNTSPNAYDTYQQRYVEYLERNPEANRNPATYDTSGLRDSDGDGLSDYIELRLGTDPFNRDTDNDGYSDGEEVLEYGTDPLDPNSVPNLNGVGITNIDNKLLTSDKTPFITGYAKPGSQVVLYDVQPDGTKKEIGTGVADARGRYVINPEVPLSDGKHYLATGVKDKNGDIVDLSAVKEVDVDSTLEIPVPIVEDIKITNKKPIVFGKTQYGTTVVAHFQSLVTSSSVVADTTAGDFIVTSATPLEVGKHHVTLYAMLPNGARSEEVTVPFDITEGDNDILNPAMFKADVTQAGDGSIWWLLGALLPLLLLAALLVYMLLNKRDTVIYSVTPRQLGDIENSKVGHTFMYASDLPVTKADLTTDYIGFYLLKKEEAEQITFSEFTEFKEETIGIIARIVEEKFILERENGDVEFTKESIDMDDLPRYKIRYVFEIISTEAKPMNKFIGKRYALAKNLIQDVALLEHNKAELEEDTTEATHKA